MAGGDVPAELLTWQTHLRVPGGQDLRELLGRYDDYVNAPTPTRVTTRRGVPIREHRGWRLTVDVTVPPGPGPFPSLVFFHGGGWVLGSPSTHRRLAAELALQGLAVMSVDYRRAPKHRFPAAVEDAVVAVAWGAAHAHRFHGDGRLLVGGDSAGANLAAAVLATRTAASPEISAALLLYGVFDYHRALPALTALVGGPGAQEQKYLDPAAFEALRGDPRLSPGGAVSGFPPCWLTVGDHDPLLGETEAIASALTASGVPHQLHVASDAPHAYLQLPTHHAYAPAWEPLGAFLAEHGLSRPAAVR
jgi:acetyl esterase